MCAQIFSCKEEKSCSMDYKVDARSFLSLYIYNNVGDSTSGHTVMTAETCSSQMNIVKLH